jgi:hypothetical protein
MDICGGKCGPEFMKYNFNIDLDPIIDSIKNLDTLKNKCGWIEKWIIYGVRGEWHSFNYLWKRRIVFS